MVIINMLGLYTDFLFLLLIKSLMLTFVHVRYLKTFVLFAIDKNMFLREDIKIMHNIWVWLHIP